MKKFCSRDDGQIFKKEWKKATSATGNGMYRICRVPNTCAVDLIPACCCGLALLDMDK